MADDNSVVVVEGSMRRAAGEAAFGGGGATSDADVDDACNGTEAERQAARLRHSVILAEMKLVNRRRL